jgi:hypothetical protein
MPPHPVLRTTFSPEGRRGFAATSRIFLSLGERFAERSGAGEGEPKTPFALSSRDL